MPLTRRIGEAPLGCLLHQPQPPVCLRRQSLQQPVPRALAAAAPARRRLADLTSGGICYVTTTLFTVLHPAAAAAHAVRDRRALCPQAMRVSRLPSVVVIPYLTEKGGLQVLLRLDPRYLHPCPQSPIQQLLQYQQPPPH